jgi:hypothetical protein
MSKPPSPRDAFVAQSRVLLQAERELEGLRRTVPEFRKWEATLNDP